MTDVFSEEKKSTKWLPHLTEEIVAEAKGPELGAYVIALEGWRRGLTLKWHVKESEKFKEMKTWSVDKPGKLFSLSSKERTHYFFRTRGDKVTNDAVELGSNKAATKKLLAEIGIATPEGKGFAETASDKELIDFAEQLGYPVVVKPLNGSYGRAITTDVSNAEELLQAVKEVKASYKEVLIEKQVSGDEYRIYVVGNKVAGAMKRLPANVIGDGVSTIQELIIQKNKDRIKNPRLASCLIKVNKKMKKYINKQGFTMDNVLEQGKRLFLNGISNVSKGGDPVGLGEELPKEIKEMAVKALHAVPGLSHGAVDIMFNEANISEASVLELNPTAQIGGLLFPVEGIASDVPSAIIDYYFPETVGQNEIEKDRYYFDFLDAISPLTTRMVTTSTVTPIPKGKIYARKYTIKGDVQDIGYHRGLRKQTFERLLSGFIVNHSDGSIDIVVAGTDEEMVKDFETAIWEDPERSEVEEVAIMDWSGPLKVGFEVRYGLYQKEAELEELRQEMQLAEYELKKLERKNSQYKRSSSWKLTRPIRAVGAIRKKMNK